MSYDLQVYTKQRLGTEQLTRLVLDAGLDIEPRSPTSQSLTVVRGSKKQYVFTLGNAVAIEAEDVPSEVTAVMLAPKWMYELVVEGSSSTGTSQAIRMARRLAGASNGVVLDQQTDQTWARGRMRKVAPVERGHTDIVELRWYSRRVDEPADLADRWLSHAHELLPEALPRRFGPVEPFAGRLDRDGEAAFVAAVAAEPMALYFVASAPCIGGNLCGHGREGSIRGHALQVHRSPVGQPDWRDALRRFFVAVAGGSRAFYASAEVVRNVAWSGRSIGFDGSTERTTYLAPLGRWYGLPPYPVWWSWFGTIYVPLVSAHLPAEGTTEHGNGILYEAAAAPVGRDELRGLLPPDLLAQPDTTDPNVYNPPLTEARVLPIVLRAP